MNRKLRKCASVCMILGALLLLAAAGLFVRNVCEDRAAQARAASVAERMILQMPEPVPASFPHGTNVRPNPTEKTVAAFRSVEAEPSPEPDFSMPTMEIDGAPYVGLLSIPSVSLELPVAAQWSEEQLQTGPCAYCGSYYSDDLTVIGHNYRSQFRPLLDLPIGTELLLTTVNGEVLRYLVANREIIAPTEVERLTGETGPDDWDLSLVTCTLGAQSRCVLRCVRSLGGA